MAHDPRYFDLVVVGSGIAGLTAAAAAAERGLHVGVISKAEELDETNTRYAQGGIVGHGDGDSRELLVKDIATAGAEVGSPEAIRLLAAEGPDLVDRFLSDRVGVRFTIEQDGNLLSASGADIDLFVEGDATSTPLAWQAPVPNVGDENTWGHYGVTSQDDVLSTGDPFGAALFAGNFDAGSPLEIFYHDGPVSGTGTTGEAYVAIEIEINNLQEAANDYHNQLTYVCTAVF